MWGVMPKKCQPPPKAPLDLLQGQRQTLHSTQKEANRAAMDGRVSKARARKGPRNRGREPTVNREGNETQRHQIQWDSGSWTKQSSFEKAHATLERGTGTLGHQCSGELLLILPQLF